jgi:hypothetical protein
MVVFIGPAILDPFLHTIRIDHCDSTRPWFIGFMRRLFASFFIATGSRKGH